MDVRKTVVNSFVISRVDYYNSLLAGVPRYQFDRLQSVMNTAARLIVGAKKQDHIKHVLRDHVHWLPVPQHIQFKLCLLMYKALHGQELKSLKLEKLFVDGRIYTWRDRWLYSSQPEDSSVSKCTPQNLQCHPYSPAQCLMTHHHSYNNCSCAYACH